MNGDPAALKQKISDKRLFPFYCGAVICTDIIPPLGSIDVMGAQWFYLAIVNFLFLVLFFFSGIPLKKEHNPAIILFGIFLLFGVISITFAINRVESTVVLARYIIVFFIILMVYQLGNLTDKNVRRFLGWAIAVVCLLESGEVVGLLYFKAKSAGFHNVNLHNFMLSGSISQGNKNITASNLAEKLPFLLFLIFDGSTISKLVGYGALFLSAIAIFILGSISAIGGFVLFAFLLNIALLANRKYIRHLLFFDALLAVLLLSGSLFLGKMASGNVRNYSSFVSRLAGKAENNFDSERRKLMLKQGSGYLKDHPFSGCGLGNWKITAISFDKYAFDDFRIAKHVHNDFMEMAAETGLGGGAAYAAVFFFLVFALVKYSLSRKSPPSEAFNPIGLVLLSCLGAYIIDALFNFPAERPCNQVNLGLIIGFTAALQAGNYATRKILPRKLGFALVIIILLPVLYSTAMVFRSMECQEYFKDDMWLSNPSHKASDVDAMLPDYPNLTEYAIPVNCIKGRYYMLANDGKEMLRLLTPNKDPNPNLALSADLLAEYYAARNNYDSSFFYARKAITAMPRCRLYARVFLFDCLAKKDSNAIEAYFTDLIAHATKFYLATDWEKYCASYYKCTGNGEKVLTLLDSALAACPGNQHLVAYRRQITEETDSKKHQLTADSMVVYRSTLAEAKKNYSDGNYDASIRCFKKATLLVPDDYSNYENLGLVYFQKRDFAQSIAYFKKVIDAGKFQNGRSEYFCAQAFYSLRNQAEACKYATSAAERNYPGAAILKNNCCAH